MARVEQAERPGGARTGVVEEGGFAGLYPDREDLPLRIVAARVSTWTRLKEIWAARELCVFLIRKELKVRYKNSFLGFLWSFLNPALVLLIYFLVFKVVMGTTVTNFAIYLFCGLLPWNIFNTSMLSSAGTLVSNAGIVKKVAFPREILALAQVGVATCYFFFQTCILVFFLIGFHVMPQWNYLPEVILALVCTIVFSAALSLVLSALNVYMRDIEHLIQVVLVALFFAEPIVYPWQTIASNVFNKPSFPHHHAILVAYLINPLTTIVLAFQKCLYGNVAGAGHNLAPYGAAFYCEVLGAVLVASVLLFYLALLLFRRVEGNFAEEL